MIGGILDLAGDVFSLLFTLWPNYIAPSLGVANGSS